MDAESLFRGGAADPGHSVMSLLAKRCRFLRYAPHTAGCPLSTTVVADGPAAPDAQAAGRIDPDLLAWFAGAAIEYSVLADTLRCEVERAIGRRNLL